MPAFSKALWMMAKVTSDGFFFPVSTLPIVVGAKFDSNASVICDQPRSALASLTCFGVIIRYCSCWPGRDPSRRGWPFVRELDAGVL